MPLPRYVGCLVARVVEPTEAMMTRPATRRILLHGTRPGVVIDCAGRCARDAAHGSSIEAISSVGDAAQMVKGVGATTRSAVRMPLRPVRLTVASRAGVSTAGWEFTSGPLDGNIRSTDRSQEREQRQIGG